MRNPFVRFQNGTVFIEKSHGSRSEPYKTAIGSKNGLSASIFEVVYRSESNYVTRLL